MVDDGCYCQVSALVFHRWRGQGEEGWGADGRLTRPHHQSGQECLWEEIPTVAETRRNKTRMAKVKSVV